MYERPVPVDDATVLIVKGTYTDPDTGTNYTGYYKIDLMEGSEYLPIMRNFRYQINIQKVNRKGKSTVAGAINGAGSADISADISTASQTGISDGKSSIAVSFTEETLPIGGTYTLGVTFVPDVTNGVVDNSLVTYELLAPEENGAVIESEDDISFDASTGTLTFTTTEVDAVHIKSQKIRIIGTSSSSRLYREVTIRLLPQQSMTVSCIPVIEAEPGTAQTITVTIPKDLPQSIFPLQFKVEVANKTLTPNAGDLPVEPGATIIPNQDGSSYQFVKTISYSDYTAAYSGNYSSFTCEFKSIIGDSGSDVYVANRFFATGSTSFTTFVKRFFSQLAFSTAGAVNEDDPVQFTFVMDAEHETGKLIPETVDVYLTGLIPDYDNINFSDDIFQNVSGNHYVYNVPRPGTGTQRLYLLSTGETPYYDVALSAEYYEDNRKTNVPMEFTNLNFNSTVYYGTGWPTTFRFTIPNSYEMPAVGYIDIELNLTNLVPNDANITQSGGKYYYRASSKGTHTLNLKTAGSQTASVAVELIHGDFVPASASQSTRSYLSIASGRITNGISGVGWSSRPFRYSSTVTIYRDKSLSTQVSSYTIAATDISATATSNSAASFASNIINATDKLYLSLYSRQMGRTYYVGTTAEALYNNGNAVTLTFSTLAPGKHTVTINTTTSSFSTTDLTESSDGVTVTFDTNSFNQVAAGYVKLNYGIQYFNVSAEGIITSITFNVTGTNYRSTNETATPGTVTRNNNTYTWTDSTSASPSQVRFSLTKSQQTADYRIRISSITVEYEDID
jgi:hypothetical protein